MTERETLEVLTVLAASYPDTFRGETEAVKRARVQLWAESFADIPAELVRKVVQAHILSDSGEFFPRVSTLRRKCVEAMTDDAEKPIGETEAWALVRRALGNSYYGAADEFARLPKIIRRIVGSPTVLKDWGQMPPETLSVEQSHFLRNYRAAMERDANDRAIPEALKAGIERAGALAAGRQDPFISAADIARQIEAGTAECYLDL